MGHLPQLRRNDIDVVIRERRDEDLAARTQLARLVHDVGGYPPYLLDDRLGEFIQSSDAIAAWVAETHRRLVGHVALHSCRSQAVMSVASAMAEGSTDRFGVVARLFVPPAARRTGVACTLLQTAAAHAVGLGLRPMLDVVTQFQPAITLMNHVGGNVWVKRVGTVTVALPDSNSIDEFVYLAPFLKVSS
jgi:GNAT superfamily N-acetyltransferase